MDSRGVSMELELEQAHSILDEYGIDRIDPDSLMILSLRGRIDLMLERVRESDEVL